MDLGALRPEPKRRFKSLECSVRFPRLGQRDAKIIVRFRILRLDCDGLTQSLRRRGGTAGAQLGNAGNGQHTGAFAVASLFLKSGGALKFDGRYLAAPRALEKPRKNVVGRPILK